MRVSDVMSDSVVAVPPDMPLRDVARLLQEHRISGVPVVEDGACLGVLSEADLLVKQLGRSVSRRMPIEWIIGEHHDPAELRRRAATTAREAMSSPAVTITGDRPVREAAALMVDRNVNRLPVVREGRVVGILTRSDLVRAYLRLDAEILRIIREEILRGTMWLDPDSLQVTVREAIVYLDGTVDRRSTARIVEKLVGLVDGVGQVVSTLRWELDDTSAPSSDAGDAEPGAASVTRREPLHPMHR
ncbi:MAG TPA: CBS domain-containing protein [Candidatus Angelobacter sp.]|nr:CBS domain-containing protein [Candidatus Angelobacter sp.]